MQKGCCILKNKKAIIILCIAIVCAIISGVGLYSFLVPQRATIYVYKGNYEAGTTLTSDMLTPMQVDARIVSNGANKSTDSYYITSSTINDVLKKGNKLKTNVVKGMPVIPQQLSVEGGNALEYVMKPESIAVTIPVNSNTGITNDLKAGSRVNIYTCHKANSGGQQTQLLFQNMKVLAVYKSDGQITSVTIEVNHSESLKLIYATTYEIVYLGLVNESGYQSSEGQLIFGQ